MKQGSSELTVNDFKPFDNKWLPDRDTMPYGPLLNFQNYLQFKILAVKLEIYNPRMNEFITLATKEEKIHTHDNIKIRYLWDTYEQFEDANLQKDLILNNFTRLSKIKHAKNEQSKPVFEYTLKPKYNSGHDGWLSTETADGFGSYDELVDTFNKAGGLRSLLDKIQSPDVLRFQANSSPTGTEKWNIPKLFFWPIVQFDGDGIYVGGVQKTTTDFTFDYRIKTLVTFRGPRIDQLKEA